MKTHTINRAGNLLLHTSTDQTTGDPMLRLEGPLDADAAPGLTGELERRLLSGQDQLHLDLSAVHFISSAGIGSLIASIGEYRDEGGDIVLHAIPGDLLPVFEMLGLLDYVTRVE